MSYLSKLRDRRKTPGAVWHKLRTSISTEKFEFYAAFEGEEDEEFYSHFIYKRYPGLRFRPLICEGKGGVLALRSEVIRMYGSARNVIFFVDSDHDKFVGVNNDGENTFITCGYSIENYILDESVIIEGVLKYFQFNRADPLINEVRRCLKIDVDVFQKRTFSVMIYAVALREMDISPDLDAITLRDLFAVVDGELQQSHVDCADLLRKAGVSEISTVEYRMTWRRLRYSDWNCVVRGKLTAQFVLNFCRNLQKRLSRKSKINGKPVRAKIDFSKRNLVSIFSEFIEEPVRLRSFLDEMIDAL